jgi:hypothetical protein
MSIPGTPGAKHARAFPQAQHAKRHSG